jgi:hypothetical protein
VKFYGNKKPAHASYKIRLPAAPKSVLEMDIKTVILPSSSLTLNPRQEKNNSKITPHTNNSF